MANSYNYRQIRFERYFRDPVVGDNFMGIGVSSKACLNIRIALRALGYGIKENDIYDLELERVVKAFQQDYNHPKPDGCFGKRTRTLLTTTLRDTLGDRAFSAGMIHPAGEPFPSVFLGYARDDIAAARRLYRQLNKSGVNIWFDQESLPAGADFKTTTDNKIRESRFFLALLSKRSVNKKGDVQRELKLALSVWAEYPPSQVYLIPIRLEECKPLEPNLVHLNWVDMFPKWARGLNQIRKTLATQD